LRLVVGEPLSGSKLRWVGVAPEALDEAQWRDGLAAVKTSFGQALEALGTVSEAAPDLVRLCERASGFVERVDFFGAACASESVRWLDVGSQLNLVESPLDIAETVRTRLLSSNSEPGSQRAWIFTSATLGEDARLKWFTESCGLTEAEILKVQSPFDYARQAALYVPMHLSRPSAPEHSLQVAEFVAKTVVAMGGRTLVLTTTLRALRTVSDALHRQFTNANVLEILVQGQQSKRQLMDRFRLGDEGGRAGCVLVASASFWEGFDVPGDALQLLIIDKLPFPPPNDPLVEARSKRLEAQGRSVFNDYFIPEAAVALKQGAGRLIRRETDLGVLVVCDTRLALMGYGKRLLAALPAMKKLGSEEEFAQALSELTRTSTRDSDWS
jgi:ATP-dependent DNA helicase DinG